VFLEATVTVSDKASNLYLYDGNDQVISLQHIRLQELNIKQTGKNITHFETHVGLFY
jgi:hypothetical protein